MFRLYTDESGTTAIEYALIASLSTVVLAGVLSSLQGGLRDLYSLVVVLAGTT